VGSKENARFGNPLIQQTRK